MVRRRFRRTWAVAAAGTALLTVLVVGVAPLGARAGGPAAPFTAPSAPQDDPFYQPPVPLPAVPPGTVLRVRAVSLSALGLPLPLGAWQIMYTSTDTSGAAAASVATVVAPLTPALTSPRPLVSYQVAQDSGSMSCAPSYELRAGNEKELVALPALVGQGWAVVIPDYEGLLSEFTAGVQAGHAVLDGIRAAESFGPLGLAGAATPVGLWGYSGGGLATAWASELAPTYFPGLNVKGIAEGGVPPDIGDVARKINGGLFSGIYFAAAVGLSRAYPGLIDMAALLNPSGRAMAQSIASQCIEQYVLGYAFQNISQYTLGGVDPLTLPGVQQAIALDRLGQHRPVGPIYLYHSLNDELIPIADVNALAATYCAQGVSLHYHQDLTSEHNTLALTGAPGALAFLAAGFLGLPTLNTCNFLGLPLG
jgi:hypothetical protein